VAGEPGGDVPDAVAERVRVGFLQVLLVAEAEEAGSVGSPAPGFSISETSATIGVPPI
jgi:hypothetical protein